jgi:hypothetical protein
MTSALCTLVVVSCCSCTNRSELAEAKAEAQAARAQLAEAQAQLGEMKARAEAAEAALDKAKKELQALHEPLANGKTLEQWHKILLGDDPAQAVKAAEAECRCPQPRALRCRASV